MTDVQGRDGIISQTRRGCLAAVSSEFTSQTEFNIVYTKRVHTNRAGTYQFSATGDRDKMVVPSLLLIPTLLRISALVMVLTW